MAEGPHGLPAIPPTRSNSSAGTSASAGAISTATTSTPRAQPSPGAPSEGASRASTWLRSASAVFRVAHEKRWVYAAIAAQDLLIAIAICRLGYAANAFAFAFDRTAGKLLADFSATTPAFGAHVGDTGGEGCLARFRWAGANLSVERGIGERDYRLEVVAPDLRVSARLSTEGIPPRSAPSRASPAPRGPLQLHPEDRPLPVVGEAILKGQHRNLDNAVGGLDYTNRFLARRTAWRWAFALGRAQTAERDAFNLVQQGLVGAAECCVRIDGDLYPVSEGGRPLQGRRR